MIEELHISNLAVIEDTTLDFTSPYTALIGETGAGKSLVVESLSLLSGERSDFTLVRDKNKKASVSALFHLEDHFLAKHPEIQEYVDEDKRILIKRVLQSDKSNRCYLNDEMVTLNEFKTIVKHLIDIHSQNGKNELLNEPSQIHYLDFYGGEKLEKVLQSYQKEFQKWKDLEKEEETLLSQNKELDRDYLSFQIAEIEKYDLKENEIEDLNNEYESLRSYDKLKEKYQEFLAHTQGNQITLPDLLNSAISQLRKFDGTDLESQAKEAQEYAMNTLASLSQLDDDFHHLSADPYRLDEINERLFQLKGLQRKYGKSSQEILSKLASYKEKLEQIDSFEWKKEELEKKIAAQKEVVQNQANKLSEIRKNTAEKLSAQIGSEMAYLGLRKNGFRISLTPTPLTSLGQDKCVFMVALNEGIEESSLSKAASGGESSRLMLALKVVLNALDPYDVLVFDEIDTGVSGKIASLIAKKIKEIKSHSQIIVISHLPQVVASALSYVKIEKHVKNQMTSTSARVLNDEDALKEVASMLSGSKTTESALLQAQELMKEYRD